MPETKLIIELIKTMSANNRFRTKMCKYRLNPPSLPFSPSLSAPLRRHPYTLTNRGWLLCQESGSRGVFKADFLSFPCSCQEKCERGTVSIVTAVCTWMREVLPCPSSAGLLSQPLHGCRIGGIKEKWDFCGPMGRNRGSEVVP